MHYKREKKAFLLHFYKMTPGRTDVGEQSVLCLGDLGFPTAAPCRNKHQSKGKEEIIYLDCQIPTLLT